jgi:AraC-like DNA-binding protein
MKETRDAAPPVLVIVVTADGDEEVAVEAFRKGVRSYLKEPFGTNLLPGSEAPAQPGMPHSPVIRSRHQKIHQAVRFINDNYRTDIRLVSAAREAGMSASYFSRMFRKVMGLSYQEYLNNQRITKAKSLLRTSARSVTEIAASLGFADPTGFGRIFKKLTGLTPSAFRNQPRT